VEPVDRIAGHDDAPSPVVPTDVAPIAGAVVGMTLMGIGVWQAFAMRHDIHPFELARWVVASDLVHDVIAAPIAVAVAWLVGRWLPAPARAPVRWALATSAVLVLIAWPFVRGYGRNPTIPSLLNRNYATGLGAYLAAVWVLAACWGAIASIRSRWHRRVAWPRGTPRWPGAAPARTPETPTGPTARRIAR
jgi:hypothetical protein